MIDLKLLVLLISLCLNDLRIDGIKVTANDPRIISTSSVSINNSIDVQDEDSDTSDTDEELSRVLELSKLDDAPAPVQQKEIAPLDNAEEIEDLTCCPISFVQMVKPTLCTLDKQTYEYDAIHAWLTEKRSSTFTRKEIPQSMKVEYVLVRNMLVESLIAANTKKSASTSVAPAK